MYFRDRADAERKLATMLMGYAGRPDVLVLALPRGGVREAYEVAKSLGAPLDLVGGAPATARRSLNSYVPLERIAGWARGELPETCPVPG